MKDNFEIWHYNGGYFEPDGEAILKHQIQETIGNHASTHRKNETINAIKDNAELWVFRDALNQGKYLVNMQNGVYNIEKNEFRNATPKDLFTTEIPIKYNSEADCPKIKKFLKEIIYEDDIPVLQEFIGYCLYKDYPIHRACMLLGDGKNGKSTFLNLLTKFLGNENVSNKELQDLIYNRFACSKLFGKYANISSDISSQVLSRSGRFKELTGQDRVDAEKKFKGSFEFYNYAKLIFSANKLPKTDDESYAFFRRWILISFPNTFEGDQCDPHILEKITTPEELSGLFNWSLEGVKRLLKNGEFSYGKTVEEVTEQYKILSDPMYAFIQDHVKQETDGYILKEDFREKYYKWCDERRLPKTPKNIITNEIGRHIPEMRPGKGGAYGQQKPAYRNIKWIENESYMGGIDDYGNR